MPHGFVTPDPLDMELFENNMEVLLNMLPTPPVMQELPEHPPPLTRSVAAVVPWNEDMTGEEAWSEHVFDENNMPNWVPQLRRENAEDGTEASWSSDEEEEGGEDMETVSVVSDDDFEERCLELEREGNLLLSQMNSLYASLGFNPQ